MWGSEMQWKGILCSSLKQWEAGQGNAQQFICLILFSGSSWIVTAAHCLHQSLDSEYPALHDSDLLRPSDFKVIMGERGAA